MNPQSLFRRIRPLLGLSIIASLSACAVVSPYDSEFQCNRNRDFGKCTDVQGAYTDALGGSMDDKHPVEEPNGKKKKSKDDSMASHEREDNAVAQANLNRYKSAEYRELAGLIEAPVTPVVAPPKVLRSLVVAYATPEKTLYLPRYVYFFVSEGNFVVGDYLNSEKPQDASVMYPNGGQTGAFR